VFKVVEVEEVCRYVYGYTSTYIVYSYIVYIACIVYIVYIVYIVCIV
jgi:hypothetical protein